uniref:Uncharacterized protein n=1 Tax=Hucho hucho TaxID=62062 RepID=A0A4W5QSK8_9TELE
MKRLEEEIKFNSYMVSDKLPKELESKRWMVQYLQKVVSKPDMSQAELRELEDTIRENNIEINQLTEKRMMRNDPMDDKLSLQAAGENSQARDLEGDEVIRGDEGQSLYRWGVMYGHCPAKRLLPPYIQSTGGW